ncbi:DNA-binding protein [Armatimonadota bacterium]|nr:DNA-binding protein [Armatimonadota bacterium]
MPPSEQDNAGHIELITRIASLYYLDNLTQADISVRVGLSRIKVVRLLKKARELGIVEIRIQTLAVLRTALETALIRKFGLQQVLLVADQLNEVNQRELTAQVAAAQLSLLVQDGDRVAVGMGRNVGAVAGAVGAVAPRRCVFVAAIGGSPLVGQPVNSSDISRRLAERFGGDSACLYAPAYVESPQLRESFLNHEDVQSVLESARRARIALVGIGDARNQSAVVQMGCFSAEDMARLREAGAVGDILGYFFDIHGRPIGPGMSDRAISVSGDDLRAIPCVIAVVSESEKNVALLGALRAGLLNVLITSVGNARRLLEADEPVLNEHP